MSWQAWTSVSLTLLMMIAMALGWSAPDIVLLAGLTTLTSIGIITPDEAFAGFANHGMLTVAVLFVVAAGVQQTGGLDFIAARLFGSPKSIASAQLRMMVPVAALSAFINNTPLVAMMMPVVGDWARRIRVKPSKLFIPLSYATILGGTCSLIGTATNLVVLGLTQARYPHLDVPMFEVGRVGLPVAIAGILYTLVTTRWLLPARGPSHEALENAREYMVGMRVEPGSPIVGRTIEQASLRQLPGLFLIEVEREDGETLPAPGPEVKLRAHDHLVFAGVIDSVVDLQKIRGLLPANEDLKHLAEKRPERRLVEAVVAARSSLLGSTIRELGFRSKYNAAVIAVHHQGERVRQKIGDIELVPGDVLLLETHPSFVERFRNDPTFALVSEVQNGGMKRHEKGLLAAAILLAMIVSNTLDLMPLLPAAMIAAGAMIATRCLTVEQAVAAIDLRVLLVIAPAFGIGTALTKSGAAGQIAGTFLELAKPFGTLGLLAAMYIATVTLNAIVTAKASAVLIFPIVFEAVRAAGLDFKPFMYVLMLAASANFMTPISYQTNLMVYGPGRYRFTDFVRFGLPLQILLGVVTVVVAWRAWF